MDDVESIIRTCCRLLDAVEVSFMAESRHALPLFLDLDVATPHAEAYESTIQNTHNVCVVFLLRVFGRVQIQSVGDSREKNDEDGAPLAAQNKYTSN